MTVFFFILAALGWAAALSLFMQMRKSVQSTAVKIMDDFLKKEINPILEKHQKDTGNVLSAHAVKLALAYADHASQMEGLQFTASQRDEWRGRCLGAREVAFAIQKSHEKIYGSSVLS